MWNPSSEFGTILLGPLIFRSAFNRYFWSRVRYQRWKLRTRRGKEEQEEEETEEEEEKEAADTSSSEEEGEVDDDDDEPHSWCPLRQKVGEDIKETYLKEGRSMPYYL